jgi:hypothetical protein
MNKLKDKDLREALIRKEARRTKPEVPVDFCDSIMEEIAPKQSRRPIWRWMAAAASLLLLIGIGVTLFPFSSQTNKENLLAKNVESMPKSTPSPVKNVETNSKDGVNTALKPEKTTLEKVVKRQKTTENRQEKVESSQETVVNAQYTNPNLHYAAYTSLDDSTYQAPSRMDEFITKMADYNKVKGVPLMCAFDSSDTTAISKAYVFEDKQELNLFGRLLQAACWYDSKTPGYLLNFSNQQFFFTLKDLHKNEKYLWIAERIVGGRILLFSSHSPIETEVSSACYQNYREQLTHTNFSTSPF